MVSCKVYILVSIWILFFTRAFRGDELPREAVLSWFKVRVLEGLDLEEPPQTSTEDPDGGASEKEGRRAPPGPPRIRRTCATRVNQQPNQETTEVIVFPSSGQRASSNSSAQLFILTSAQQLLQAAESASTMSSDGWFTFDLDKKLLAFVAEGPFLLQVRCPDCECHANESDKTPFLHLHVQPRGPVRSPRQAPVTIPWSPSAINLLQRPSQERPQYGDCHRAEIQISFEELGWDNWIVHPKVLTFYYCHGNCSAWDQTSVMLGITQCCAPVPGMMRSLRITTTSDGGYSFKYETLPNIMPEECTCI
ncbi:inhibin alpha chain [Xyrichtys novacula]|uniref:Inhibin alpha chain n=1 Tax=Xyrichtys novacula TaxID=13765 RepID=A0AAV1HQ32_XYRNO|nr:inhibin alpha chain [Xyrichtys novacula]